MRQLLGYGLGCGLVGLAIACGGEVRELGDAAAGSTGTAGTGAGSGGSASVPHVCETACVENIFRQELTLCKLCHGSALQSSGLNLELPDVTARLKDVPAKHGDLAMGMTPADCPVGDKLIDSANPEASWLLKKITGQQGNCGTVMPSAGTLSPAQRACIETYVHCVAAP